MVVLDFIKAVNLKGIWLGRAPKALAVHAAGVWGPFFWGGGRGNLAEAAAEAASMQFTALTIYAYAYTCSSDRSRSERKCLDMRLGDYGDNGDIEVYIDLGTGKHQCPNKCLRISCIDF